MEDSKKVPRVFVFGKVGEGGKGGGGVGETRGRGRMRG